MRGAILCIVLPMALLLAAACGGAEKGAEPTLSAGEDATVQTATSPAATNEPAGTEVFGTLQLQFLPCPICSDASLPDPSKEIKVSLVLDSLATEPEVEEIKREIEDPDPGWTVAEGQLAVVTFDFDIELPPGDYQVYVMNLEAPGLRDGNSEPFDLILQRLNVMVPSEGCVYVGRITTSYYRLDPGSPDDAQEQVNQIAEQAGVEPPPFVHLNAGSLLGESAQVEVLAGGEPRPVGSESCAVTPAEFQTTQ